MSSLRVRTASALLVPAAAALMLATVTGPAGAAPYASGGVRALPAWTPPPGSTQLPPSATSAPVPPGPVTGLRATAVGSRSVTLAWDPVAAGSTPIVSYQIAWFQPFESLGSRKDVGLVTSTTITEDVVPNGQYTVGVTAVDSSGRTSYASIEVLTPLRDIGDVTAPSRPAALAKTGQTASTIRLAWEPSTDDVGVTGYQVLFFDGWLSSTLLTSTSGTSAEVPLLGNQYHAGVYYVRAQDNSGNLSLASPTVPSPLAPGGPSSSPSPSPSPSPPAGSCTFAYRTVSSWTGGFVAEATFTNTATRPVASWSAGFTFGGDQRISSAWNATYVQSGASVTLTGPAWNRDLAAGASVTAGLIGSRTGADTPPATATLNGVTCTRA